MLSDFVDARQCRRAVMKFEAKRPLVPISDVVLYRRKEFLFLNGEEDI